MWLHTLALPQIHKMRQTIRKAWPPPEKCLSHLPLHHIKSVECCKAILSPSLSSTAYKILSKGNFVVAQREEHGPARMTMSYMLWACCTRSVGCEPDQSDMIHTSYPYQSDLQCVTSLICYRPCSVLNCPSHHAVFSSSCWLNSRRFSFLPGSPTVLIN